MPGARAEQRPRGSAPARPSSPDEPSSFPIVVDSPPGSTSAVAALELLGRAHLGRVGAERAQQRDVLAERALQREHADAGRAHQPRVASRSASASLSSPMPTIGSPRPSETFASSFASRKCVTASTIARARGAGSPLLKIPEPTKHAVGAELHHQRRVGGRRDAAGGEEDDGQAAQLGAWP